MKKMKFKSCLLVCLVVSTILVLGQYTFAAEAPQRGGTFKVLASRPNKTMGTPWESDNWFALYGAPTMESLVHLDKEGNILPHLATSWKRSADGKSYIFELRKGVKFHDGTDFNSAAVKFSLERYERGTVAKRLESVQVVDEYTVKLNLKQHDGMFLNALGGLEGMIASPTAAVKKTTPENQAKDHMVGTGPYTFVDWSRDEYIKYKRFEGYWQKGKPYPDAMEIIFIKNPVTSALAFQSGAAQLTMRVTARTANELKAKGYEILSLPYAVKGLDPDGANTGSPWASKKVREALSYAIDRRAVTDSIGLGYWEPASQLCPYKSYVGHLHDVEERTYNPERAKKLLAEAGYPKGFVTKLFANAEENHDMLVSLQTFLANIGIKASIELLDRGRYVALRKDGWRNGLFLSTFGSSRPIKYAGIRGLSGLYPRDKSVYRPAGFLETFNRAASALNPDEENKYTEELYRMAYDESMAIPLWVEMQLAAQTKKVHDSGWCEVSPITWYPENAWLSK
ncbi:ABC transporter substrate-binding protein [Thermodesulfobacteriota bacterium]